MPASEARILANRRNSALSTGPRSASGKEKSRRNGLKHGLTGAGVVLLDEDADEVAKRIEAFQADLAPQTAYGKFLVGQMATLSVRTERAAKQEMVSIATRVRHAVEDFDQGRLDEADTLLELLGEQPRAHLRKLKRTPEGVERLIEAWHELRADLTRNTEPVWTQRHRERLTNLLGYRVGEIGTCEIEAMAKSAQGEIATFGKADVLSVDDPKTQARAGVIARIDAEIAKLEAHYEMLDFDMIEIDREQAPDRALFDPSHPATLAHRYESEARRGFYKALDAFHEAEAQVAQPQTPAASPKPVQKSAPLASSCERSAPTPREPRPTPAPARPVDEKPGFVPTGTMGGRVRVPAGSA
jgi:hypothetical protein